MSHKSKQYLTNPSLDHSTRLGGQAHLLLSFSSSLALMQAALWHIICYMVHPSSLSRGDLACAPEIFQVIMVWAHSNLMSGSQEIVFEEFSSFFYCQQFSVIDVIVLLCWVEWLWRDHHWVLSIFKFCISKDWIGDEFVLRYWNVWSWSGVHSHFLLFFVKSWGGCAMRE